tara:strand:- start:4588 stop:4863 length:276 start_codon:yes stop_codon:yes gene_type:complete
MMIKRGKSLAIKNMLHGIFLVGLVIQANVIAAQETDRDGTAANAIKSIKRFQSTRPVKAATSVNSPYRRRRWFQSTRPVKAATGFHEGAGQ